MAETNKRVMRRAIACQQRAFDGAAQRQPLASVPPPVKITSSAFAPTSAATCFARVFDDGARRAARRMYGGGIAADVSARHRVPASGGAATSRCDRIVHGVLSRRAIVVRLQSLQGGAAEHALLHHIGQRDRGQEHVDLVAQFLPQIVGDAALAGPGAAVGASGLQRVALIGSSTATMMSATRMVAGRLRR